MKKKVMLICFVFGILSINDTYSYIEEGTGGLLKEYNTAGLKCIKYNDFSSGLKDTNSDFFTVMYNNYDLKNKKEADRYNKFDQCSLSYNNNENWEQTNFKVYNKYKKSSSNIYDKIFEDTVMFDDYTNECSFSAQKGEESIFILNGEEVGPYKSILEMATVNTSDGKSKIAFSAEEEEGKIVIVENGKELFYSDKEEYKEGSLIYTNNKKIAFIEKDPFFGKEHVIVNGEQIPEYSGYEVSFGKSNGDIFVISSAQDINKYGFGLNYNYFINGIKIKYSFPGMYGIDGVNKLSNGNIVYSAQNINGEVGNFLVIDGKISKGYKSFMGMYDIFSSNLKNVNFLETENGDIYFIGKSEDDKYVVVRNNEELFKYDNKPKVIFKNTNHFIYTIERNDGKYSLVVDGKVFGVVFDEIPKINNQYFLDTSKEGIFMLDFRYKNLNNICIDKNIKNHNEYKNILLKKQFDEKFSNIFSKYGKDINSMKKLRKKLIIIRIKLKHIFKKKLSSKSKNIVKIIDELVIGYLENVNLAIKNLEKNQKLNNEKKEVKYFSESQIKSGFFEERTGKLKNNYNIEDFLTYLDLYNFIYRYFTYNTVITDENIIYLKNNIKNYIEKEGYKLKKDFKIGTSTKNGKFNGEKVFVIESKYIYNFPIDKRLIIGFGK